MAYIVKKPMSLPMKLMFCWHQTTFCRQVWKCSTGSKKQSKTLPETLSPKNLGKRRQLTPKIVLKSFKFRLFSVRNCQRSPKKVVFGVVYFCHVFGTVFPPILVDFGPQNDPPGKKYFHFFWSLFRLFSWKIRFFVFWSIFGQFWIQNQPKMSTKRYKVDRTPDQKKRV